MPDKYDRTLGLLDGLQSVDHTRPHTIRVVAPLGVGGSTTYVVTTYRQAGELVEAATPDGKERRERPTFTTFLEIVDGDRALRIVLPDAVTGALLRQRDALTATAARRQGREQAAARKRAGWRPTPPPRRPRK